MSDKTITLDAYVLDTLMADLVGHDHRPSAYLAYLAIAAASRKGRVILSHAELAERTGLAKRTVQQAVEILHRRGLIEIIKRGPTEAPEYKALAPWRR